VVPLTSEAGQEEMMKMNEVQMNAAPTGNVRIDLSNTAVFRMEFF
jgi:hypothetical protein